MLVTKKNFDEFLRAVCKEKNLGYDTETTTLSWHESPWHDFKPRVFSAQFATATEAFYLDFEHSDDRLDDSYWTRLQRELFANPEILWDIQNAKFDMHHSANYGVEFAGPVHCTKAIARVMNNDEPSLKLDDLSKRYLDAEKLDIHTYVMENGLYTKVKKFGHNQTFLDFVHYERVPLKLMYDYGVRDTLLCRKLGNFQRERIEAIDEKILSKLPTGRFGERRLKNVMLNEYALTKIFFAMEREGVLIDRAYTEEAYEHEVAEYKRIEAELDKLAAPHYAEKMDWLSAKKLKILFDALNEPYSYTEKGNACFDKDALESSDSEIAKLIIQYRYHNKRAHTYFENFLWLMDKNSVIHADAQQAGTNTGRTSYWTPNLQNVPKRGDKEEKSYKVRRCFIPKPGGYFADFDYSGAEYYMALDYSKEMRMIDLIKAGLDPHADLGKRMSLERDPAKTMQFRILYGAGNTAVGRSLGCKEEAAANRLGKQKKAEYFEQVPSVAQFLKDVTWNAKQRGYIVNWFGRYLKYDYSTAYKSPNGLIQSGVGDMTKVAQVRIAERVLPKYNVKMLLQVHDAILFWIPYGEEAALPEIKREMEAVFPAQLLPMSADGGYSAESWSSLQDEIPTSPRKALPKRRTKEAADATP